MTKCWKYWQIVSDFKYGNRECKGKTGFEGFCNWCEIKDPTYLASFDWKLVDFYLALHGIDKSTPMEELCELVPESVLHPAMKLLWKQPRDKRGRFLPPVANKERMDRFLKELIIPKVKENKKVVYEDVKQWVAKELGEPYKTRKEKKRELEIMVEEATIRLKNEFTSLPLELQENIISDLEQIRETIDKWNNQLLESAPTVGNFISRLNEVLHNILEVCYYYHQLSKEE